MRKAADIYTDMGRFTVAAKHHQTIAEIYESEGNCARERSRSKSKPKYVEFVVLII